MLGKKVAGLLLVLVICVSLIPVAAFAEEPELRDLNVPLGWLYNDEFVAPAVAQAKGFYEEAGLDPRFISGGGATGFDPVKAINGFDQWIRIGIEAALSQAIIAHASGEVDVQVVLALHQIEPSGFITIIDEETGRRAQGPCDFKGRVVSMQPDSTWYVDALGAVCEDGPISSGEDFQVIPAGWTPDCLLVGGCDYYCGWATNQVFMLAQEGLVDGEDFEMFLTADYLPFYYVDVVVTTKAFIDEHPEVVKAFVDATVQGMQYTLDNPEEAIEIAGALEGVDPAHAEWRIPIQNPMMTSPATEEHGLGYMDLDKVQEMIDFMAENGQIEESFPAEELVDNSFLPGNE